MLGGGNMARMFFLAGFMGGLTWTHSAFADRIRVDTAIYGANVGVAANNAGAYVAGACDGKEVCSFRIDVQNLGDPARGKPKDFVVSYTCGAAAKSVIVPEEAGMGKVATLDCRQGAVASIPPPVNPPRDPRLPPPRHTIYDTKIPHARSTTAGWPPAMTEACSSIRR
jgi:hypothetical protein